MPLRDIAFYTHLITLGIAVCGILFADHMGFGWIRGKTPTLNPKTLVRTHWVVGISLGAMLGSGSVLFWNAHQYLLTDPTFYIKMTFVLALIINSFVIERFLNVATTQPFATLTKKQKLPLIISGAVSTLSWIGAATTAFFLF